MYIKKSINFVYYTKFNDCKNFVFYKSNENYTDTAYSKYYLYLILEYL